MFYFILTIHVLLCLLIIGLVLLQQGKGAQVGAILSGSNNTLFGAAGATTTFAKLTTIFAICFFITSILLIRMYGSPGAIHLPSNVPGARTDALAGTALGDIVAKQNAAAEAVTVMPNADVPNSGASASIPAANPAPAVDEASKTK